MERLEGPRAKLLRADELIETLRAKLRVAMGDPGGKEFAVELMDDTYDGLPAISLRVTGLPDFSTDVGVLIGEVVHNLRSGLDELAWALVHPTTRRGMKPGALRNIYFPMAHSAQGFSNRISDFLPGTTDADRAFIAQYQPYRRSPRGRAMRTLNVLSNEDKHRVIIPALFYPVDFDFKLDFDGAKRIDRIIRIRRGEPMKVGTDLLTWTFSDKPKNVRMNVTIANSPGFNSSLVRPRPGNDFEDVSGTLTTISATCAEVLVRFDQ